MREVADALNLDDHDTLRLHVLASLPERERDVVTCREVLDLDVPSTAQALGISSVAVRVAHHRALRRLREKFPQSM